MDLREPLSMIDETKGFPIGKVIIVEADIGRAPCLSGDAYTGPIYPMEIGIIEGFRFIKSPLRSFLRVKIRGPQRRKRRKLRRG